MFPTEVSAWGIFPFLENSLEMRVDLLGFVRAGFLWGGHWEIAWKAGFSVFGNRYSRSIISV